MRSLGLNQLILLGACVVVIVLLGFASTTPSHRNVPEAEVKPPGVPLEAVIKEERNSLRPDESGAIAALEQAIKNESDIVRRGQLYDSLVKYLGRSGKYVLASFYAEE